MDACQFVPNLEKIFDSYGLCIEDIDTFVAENYIDALTL